MLKTQFLRTISFNRLNRVYTATDNFMSLYVDQNGYFMRNKVKTYTVVNAVLCRRFGVRGSLLNIFIVAALHCDKWLKKTLSSRKLIC